MIPVPVNTGKWLAEGVTDMRRGFTTLCAASKLLGIVAREIEAIVADISPH